MAERFSKVWKVAAGIILVLVVGFLLSKLRSSSGGATQAFLNARSQGALISDSIVDLSNQISADLSRVNEYDTHGQTREALDLTLQLRAKVQDVKSEADQLSEQLKNMVADLDKIQDPAARQAALDAITSRMALISRLMSYGQYLDQLIEVLSNHFTGSPDRQSVQVVISQINAEVTAVNNFNRQAHQAMERFDGAR